MKVNKYLIFFYLLTLLVWVSDGLITPVQARELPNFVDLVEKYGPAVVNISTTAKRAEEEENFKGDSPSQSIPGLPENSPFNDFFRRFFNQEGDDFLEERPSTSLGSGFIISPDGYIVSNNHVTKDAEEIVVRLSDRREFNAEVIGMDERSDLALLKIEATNLPTVLLGSAKDLRVGEWVLAIGSPFGFEHSATAGIVSAKGRSLPSDSYVPFIQTDVAINPGNSGGPLFNMDGKVVGVNSQIYSRTGGFMGLSFAIPVDVMTNVVEQLKANGKVVRGWLGVLIQDVTRELAESFDMEKPQGALIAKILPDSPAEAAGFKVGDIIVKFGEREVERSADLPPIVGATPVGSKVNVAIVREGKEETLSVSIAELPPEEDLKIAVGKGDSKSVTNKTLAMSVVDLSDEDRESLDISEGGVMVRDIKSGPARDSGIRKGDVIVMLDNVKVKDVPHFKELADNLKPGQSIPVLINRRGSPLFLALKIPTN